MSILDGIANIPHNTTAGGRDDKFEQGVKAMLSKDNAGNLGPIMMGWVIDFMLFGLLAHQFITWLTVCPTDRRFNKIAVWAVVLSSTASTAWSFDYMWRCFVSGFGTYTNFVSLYRLTWYTILGIFTTLPTQIFYAERAYRLFRGKIWVILVLTPPIVVSVVGAIGAKVISTQFTGLRVANLQPWFYVWLGGLLIADVMLTMLIAIGLYQSRTGWADTDRVVVRLIRLTFETQLPCTAIAVIFMGYYAMNHVSIVNAFFEIVHPKFYAVSLMTVLNARTALRQDLSGGARSASGPSNRKEVSFPSSSAPSTDIQLNPLNAPLNAPVTYGRSAYTRNVPDSDETYVLPEVRYAVPFRSLNRQSIDESPRDVGEVPQGVLGEAEGEGSYVNPFRGEGAAVGIGRYGQPGERRA